MYKPSSNSRQASLFWDLETMLDSKHALFKLANMVDWSLFEKSFAPLFCADNGRPPKPIRLMTGLLMLKHLRNVSDEQVVVQFTENAYYLLKTEDIHPPKTGISVHFSYSLA